MFFKIRVKLKVNLCIITITMHEFIRREVSLAGCYACSVGSRYFVVCVFACVRGACVCLSACVCVCMVSVCLSV